MHIQHCIIYGKGIVWLNFLEVDCIASVTTQTIVTFSMKNHPIQSGMCTYSACDQ